MVMGIDVTISLVCVSVTLKGWRGIDALFVTVITEEILRTSVMVNHTLTHYLQINDLWLVTFR